MRTLNLLPTRRPLFTFNSNVKEALFTSLVVFTLLTGGALAERWEILNRKVPAANVAITSCLGSGGLPVVVGLNQGIECQPKR
jgi:hypothetical protein